MARKPLGTDKFGIQKVMRTGDYFGDAVGQFSLNAISGLIGQLTYFYTDKVGVAAGTVTVVMLVVKILDAFTDLIMGYIVDHTAPGKERYRPWLRRMMVPMLIMIVMLFTVPRNIGTPGQMAYMFITNFLLSAVIYTALAIPYNALLVVRTSSQEERGTMGTFRAAAGYVSGMVIAVTIIPVTNMLGGDQRAWVIFGATLAVVAIICLFITYKTSKETNPVMAEEQTQNEENLPFLEAIGKLFHNKYWVTVLIMSICVNISYGLTNTSGTYYAKWIYGDDNLVGIMGAVGMIPTLLGFALVGPMIKKLGVTKTLKVSFIIGLVSNVLKLVNPYHFTYNLFLGCFGTFANIPTMCLLGVLTAMAIDYNEYKFGNRMLATSQSANSFGGKVGNGVGASLVSLCLAIAGYDYTQTVASAATKQAIFTFSIYVPIALFAILLICSIRFDLEKKLPDIHKEIAARKKNQ